MESKCPICQQPVEHETVLSEIEIVQRCRFRDVINVRGHDFSFVLIERIATLTEHIQKLKERSKSTEPEVRVDANQRGLPWGKIAG